MSMAPYPASQAVQGPAPAPTLAVQLTAVFDTMSVDEQVAFYDTKIKVRDALADGRTEVAKGLILAVPTLLLPPHLKAKRDELLALFPDT